MGDLDFMILVGMTSHKAYSFSHAIMLTIFHVTLRLSLFTPGAGEQLRNSAEFPGCKNDWPHCI